MFLKEGRLGDTTLRLEERQASARQREIPGAQIQTKII